MTEEESNIDYELITRYLAGETSAEEQKAVAQWLSASEKHRRAFEQLKMLWEQSGRIIPREEPGVDVDRGWQQLKDRIQPESNGTAQPETAETKTRSLLYYFSRVAAVLVLGLTIYLFYQNRQKGVALDPIQLTSARQVITDTLPDGSLISLNTRSQLSFPREFSSDERRVSLRGEAFFKVVPNPRKPFIVKIKEVEITVLGTSFLVSAYDTSNTMTVGVAEGRVKVATPGAGVTLEAGESISIDRATQRLSPVAFYDANDLYWKSKTLVFQRKKLQEVFKTLEKTYNVRITTANDKILNCKLTAKFYGESIHRIFEIINTNFNLTAKNEGNHFIISGSGCD